MRLGTIIDQTTFYFNGKYKLKCIEFEFSCEFLADFKWSSPCIYVNVVCPEEFLRLASVGL